MKLNWYKTLKEIKVGLDISISSTQSYEIFVLNQTHITRQQYESFTQDEFLKVVYVDQFDDQLWEGYSIIEPTKQMRDYKKMK